MSATVSPSNSTVSFGAARKPGKNQNIKSLTLWFDAHGPYPATGLLPVALAVYLISTGGD
jgi:hypothetical protein